MRNRFPAVVICVLLALPAVAGLEEDRAQIRQAALDYIQGWYEGDADRVERAVHPDLAKRILQRDGEGRSRLDHMSAMGLVQGARGGWGSRTPPEQRVHEIEILDVYENIASVKITAKEWIDYLHLGRADGHWVIINVLWEMKPEVLRSTKP